MTHQRNHGSQLRRFNFRSALAVILLFSGAAMGVMAFNAPALNSALPNSPQINRTPARQMPGKIDITQVRRLLLRNSPFINALPGQPATANGPQADGIITTYAGGGGGDERRAIHAAALGPTGVAVGRDGSLYFSEFVQPFGDNRVRKIDRSGIIHAFAGTGAVEPFRPYSGDGQPAVQAPSMRPYNLATDAAGNVYIVDSFNDRIRKVDTSGIITTFAGNGRFGFSGDGGPAIDAKLNIFSGGLTLDRQGNLYIADDGNNRVRKVDRAGIITTVAGNGKASNCLEEDCTGLIGDGGRATRAVVTIPLGLAFDGAGSLYIAAPGDDRIRKVDPAGIITTYAGNGTIGYTGDGGPATQAALAFPPAVAVDSAGNLYFSDNFNTRIRKVDAVSQIITTIAGSDNQALGDGGPATAAQIKNCFGIAVDSADNLYLTDLYYNRIRKVNRAGIINTIAGTGRSFAGDGGPATKAAIDNTYNFSFIDPTGNFYLTDTYNDRIRKVDPLGVITTIAGDGFNTCGVEAGIGDDSCHGRFAGDGGPAITASLNRPSGMARDHAGNIYIADRDNNRIRKIDPSGIMTTVAGNGQNDANGLCLPPSPGIGDGGPATSGCLGGPLSVAVDRAGNLYIADAVNARIRKVDTAGIITTYAGNGERGTSGDGGPATDAALDYITGVALDRTGNLYIATFFQNRVRKVDAALSEDGTHHISTVAGTGTCGFSGDGSPATSAELCIPEGVVVAADGNLYIADTDNERVRKVDTSGIITSVAGGSDPGTYYYGGDGGPATKAGFYFPTGVVVSASGDLYISDSLNRRIRKVRMRR